METFSEKFRVINEFVKKLSVDEKKLVLSMLIKTDMKLFFDAIFEEQKFLEKECGISGVFAYEETESDDIHDEEDAGKVSKEAENAYYLDKKRQEKLGNDKFDGFLGYVNDSGDHSRVELDDAITEKTEGIHDI